MLVKRHGAASVVGVFADTKIEDPDLYRFLDDVERVLGIEVVRIEDGRDPFQVFRDVRFLGNTRVDPCSRVLKREVVEKWLSENATPDDVIVFGIGPWEAERFERIERRNPRKCAAPLIEGTVGAGQVRAWLAEDGIELPALYREGFPHNNCGGACVKAGQAQWRHLLKMRPQTFAIWEAFEVELRAELDKPVAILRDRRGGDVRPLPLGEFREWVEAEGEQLELLDWGGCACFAGPEDEATA
jgi:3'-phosphoadenosine 5'-phosphosulfate sulfotransferase (PAPS reductase)/FAD synthetase